MFKKGEVSNPFGSLPVGEDLKNARKLSKLEFERLANLYLHKSWDEINDIVTKKKTQIPAVEMMIISIIHKGIIEGDPKYFIFLLDRTIGQAVRIHRVITEVDDTRKEAPLQMSDQEKLEMVKAYEARVKERIESQRGLQAIEVKPIKS